SASQPALFFQIPTLRRLQKTRRAEMPAPDTWFHGIIIISQTNGLNFAGGARNAGSIRAMHNLFPLRRDGYNPGTHTPGAETQRGPALTLRRLPCRRCAPCRLLVRTGPSKLLSVKSLSPARGRSASRFRRAAFVTAIRLPRKVPIRELNFRAFRGTKLSGSSTPSAPASPDGAPASASVSAGMGDTVESAMPVGAGTSLPARQAG